MQLHFMNYKSVSIKFFSVAVVVINHVDSTLRLSLVKNDELHLLADELSFDCLNRFAEIGGLGKRRSSNS
jgi:hypothetical protein